MFRPTTTLPLLLSLFAGLHPSLSANDLQLPAIDLKRDSSAPLTLAFRPSPEPVVAMQFDVEFDPSAIQLTAIAGEAARQAGKSLYSAALSSTKTRYIISGWNQTAILAGPLIRFLAGVTASADEQVYPLRISNLVATFPNGTSAPIAATDGSITVLAGTSERLSEAGVLNAASLTAGPVAPGEIATLLGHGIGPAFRAVPEAGPSSLALGGTSVWFDGKQAPLLLASSGQINAIVPYSVAGQTTEIVVRKEGLTAATASVPVGPAAPGIFVLSGNGVGPAAILNEDSTVNSAANPAQRGAVISIFATGAGRMDPPGADGQIGNGASQHPLLQVSVRIGDQDAEVLYAGAAPGLIAGALQVNCSIPLNVAAGVAVSVVFTVGEQTSPAGTTLSIQ